MKYTDYYNYLTESETYIKSLIARALKKHPDADKQEVYSYCNTNSTGISIKKFEDDAKSRKWDTDTIKAICYVMSRNRQK